LQQLVELEPQHHKEFVNSEIVYTVPMQIEDMQESREPLLFVFSGMKFAHYLTYLLGTFLLV
jgi:hypothetical protein